MRYFNRQDAKPAKDGCHPKSKSKDSPMFLPEKFETPCLSGRPWFPVGKNVFKVFLIFFLVFILALSPRMVPLALAQETKDSDSAPDGELLSIQQLAKKGYLGDKKDFYLSAKTLTEDGVTDALLKINDLLSQADLKSLKPGEGPYKLNDLKALLRLSEEKADDIRGRKVSAWRFTNRIKKMIEALTPPEPAATPDATPAQDESAAPPASAAPAAPGPVAGPTRGDWDNLRDSLKDLAKKVSDLQAAYDLKMSAFQKTDEEIKSADAETKAAAADNLEQLNLVKKMMDRVQDDLKKTEDRLEEVAQKASQKSITDTALEQELDIMHKDLRDDTQDVSILKQEVARLDKSGSEEAQSPFDKVLASKWLPGGALLLGLAALIVSLTKK